MTITFDEEEVRRRFSRKILICASGSIGTASLPTVIAHFKMVVPECDIRVALTRQANKFVPQNTFSILTNHKALMDWDDDDPTVTSHIELTEWAEIVLAMPATANLLGKAAAGIGDDLVTTCLLAAQCPIIFVPAMNQTMWVNPIVQRNVESLRACGRYVLEPSEGIAASSGEVSRGSLPPLRDLLTAIMTVLSRSACNGTRNEC